MPQTLPWVEGKRLLEATRSGVNSRFDFSDEVSVRTQCGWLVLPGPTANQAIEPRMADILGKEVVECRLDPATVLVLVFENGLELRFISFSGDHESWRVQIGSKGIASIGNGTTAFYTDEEG